MCTIVVVSSGVSLVSYVADDKEDAFERADRAAEKASSLTSPPSGIIEPRPPERVSQQSDTDDENERLIDMALEDGRNAMKQRIETPPHQDVTIPLPPTTECDPELVRKLVDESVTISDCIPGLARLFNEPNLSFCTGLKRFFNVMFCDIDRVGVETYKLNFHYHRKGPFLYHHHPASLAQFLVTLRFNPTEIYQSFQYVFVEKRAERRARTGKFAVAGSMDWKVLAEEYGCSLVEFTVNKYLLRTMNPLSLRFNMDGRAFMTEISCESALDDGCVEQRIESATAKTSWEVVQQSIIYILEDAGEM
uniref:ARID domain-containing protein n=1 Tax=Angiostrongylus cantonensis TaxID=6313 RepID=A0A0K0DNQ1_ANGCA